MADIKLIDAQGDERTYSGVAKVKIPLADGTGNATFIQPAGKKELTGTNEVNVTNFATAQVVDENLIAENIKSGVSILGVEGTHEGGGNDNPKPIEVSSVVDMTTALLAAEVGSVYKYTGENGTVLEDMSTFEKGALYEIQKATAGEVRRWAKLQSDEWIIDFYIVADANTTLPFKAVDGMKWSEWLVTDYNAQTITTLADGTMVFSDSDVRINADINDYIIAGHTYTVTVPALTSPTIDITETTLNIYDEEGLATSYDILVDGEVKATVEKVSTVSITLKAHGGWMSDTGSTTYIKFGAAPTSSDDWDYYIPDGARYLVAKTATNLNDITIDVIPTAYIWCNRDDGYAGYTINDGGEPSNYTRVGVGYTNATIVTLSDGDNLWLRSAELD